MTQNILYCLSACGLDCSTALHKCSLQMDSRAPFPTDLCKEMYRLICYCLNLSQNSVHCAGRIQAGEDSYCTDQTSRQLTAFCSSCFLHQKKKMLIKTSIQLLRKTVFPLLSSHASKLLQWKSSSVPRFSQLLSVFGKSSL